MDGFSLCSLSACCGGCWCCAGIPGGLLRFHHQEGGEIKKNIDNKKIKRGRGTKNKGAGYRENKIMKTRLYGYTAFSRPNPHFPTNTRTPRQVRPGVAPVHRAHGAALRRRQEGGGEGVEARSIMGAILIMTGFNAEEQVRRNGGYHLLHFQKKKAKQNKIGSPLFKKTSRRSYSMCAPHLPLYPS